MRVQFSNKSRAYATISLRINSNSINPSIGRRISTLFPYRSCKNLKRSLFSKGRISTSFLQILQEFREIPFLQGNGSQLLFPIDLARIQRDPFSSRGRISISFASILQEFRETPFFKGDGSRFRFSIDLARIQRNPFFQRETDLDFVCLDLARIQRDPFFQGDGSRLRFPRSCKNLEGPLFSRGTDLDFVSLQILQEFRETPFFKGTDLDFVCLDLARIQRDRFFQGDGSRLRFLKSCKNLEKTPFFKGDGSRLRLPRSCKNLERPFFSKGTDLDFVSLQILQEFREDSIFQEVQASIEILFRRSKRAQLEALVVYSYSYFDTQFRRWFRSGEGGEGTTNASALSFPRKFRALEIVGECSTPSGVGWNKTV